MQHAAPKPLYKQRWFVVVMTALVLCVVVLLALPYGLSYGLGNWLRQNGGDQVSIQDIDINLFTGRASIENLHLSVDARELMTIPRLDLNVDWLPLFSRQLVVRSIHINGVALEIEQSDDGSLRVGGISLPAADAADDAEAGKQWHLGVDVLEIAATSINFRSPALQVEARLDDLQLGGIKTWLDGPASLAFNGSINGAAISLDGEIPPLSSGAGYRGGVRIDGLDLAGFAGMAGEAVSALSGRLSVTSQLDVLVAPGAPLTVSQSGTVSLAGLGFGQADGQVAVGAAGWDGTLEVTAGDTSRILAEGAVKASQADVSLAGNHTVVGEAVWNGRVDLEVGEATRLAASGNVQATQVDFDIDGSAVRLAHVDSLKAGELSVKEGGELVLSALRVTGVVLAKDEQGAAIVTLGGLELDTANVAQDRIALGQLTAHDLVTGLRRNEGGKWQVVEVIDSLQQPAKTTATAESPEQAAEPGSKTISIESIAVTGDSAISMQDESVQPVFKSNLVVTAADIGRIDSASPAVDTPVRLAALTGKHSRIDFKGTVRPFAERPTLDLKADIKAVALTEVSPYTVDALGYALKSGLLDADSTIKIDNGILDVSNKLTIRGLELSGVDNASREKFDKQIAMPMDTALNMLRDKHDNIKLDLLVDGDIDNPNFDFSDVILTAVSKAVRNGSMTYLALALQPYGALISIAKMAGEAASNVRLDPVVFPVGGYALPGESHAYLDKVAGILKNRPELNIKICGMASEQDRMALGGPVYASPTAGGRLPDTVIDAAPAGTTPEAGTVPAGVGVTDEQLFALADGRAAAVKDFLVTAHGVTASRLVACQPALEAAADAQARVDLLI